MRLVNPWRGAADDRAPIGAHFVEAGPSTGMAHALAATHPRVHARPDFIQEERFAVVFETMAARSVGRRVAGEDVRAVMVKIDAGRIDDHAVSGKIRGAIIDQANLPADRFTVIP